MAVDEIRPGRAEDGTEAGPGPDHANGVAAGAGHRHRGPVDPRPPLGLAHRDWRAVHASPGPRTSRRGRARPRRARRRASRRPPAAAAIRPSAHLRAPSGRARSLPTGRMECPGRRMIDLTCPSRSTAHAATSRGRTRRNRLGDGGGSGCRSPSTRVTAVEARALGRAHLPRRRALHGNGGLRRGDAAEARVRELHDHRAAHPPAVPDPGPARSRSSATCGAATPRSYPTEPIVGPIAEALDLPRNRVNRAVRATVTGDALLMYPTAKWGNEETVEELAPEDHGAAHLVRGERAGG